MFELMEKVTETCKNTNQENFQHNLKQTLVLLEGFKSRGGTKPHARDALLKVMYKFKSEDNDIAGDCIDEALIIVDGDNPKIKSVWD